MNPTQVTWFDTNLVAALLAVNPRGLKGVRVKGQYGPVRDVWLSFFTDLISPKANLFKVPANLVAEQLTGSLDIEATLKRGCLILSKGLLERAQGNFLLLPMAERMDAHVLALISQALDEGSTFANSNQRGTIHFGVIAFDESEGSDDGLSYRMMDRFAFEIFLDQFSIADVKENLEIHSEDISLARKLLPEVQCNTEFIEILTKAAFQLGVVSFRANQFAIEVAKTLAALRGLQEVGQDEVIDAARLVYTYSKMLHQSPELGQADDSDTADTPDQDSVNHSGREKGNDEKQENKIPEDGNENIDQETQTPPPSLDDIEDIIVAAVRSSVPKDLLVQAKQDLHSSKSASHISGKSGAIQNSFLSGRPIAALKGKPSGGRRIDILKSIRAAIPWQRLRESGSQSDKAIPVKNRIDFRSEDLHIKQYLKRRGTITIFLVDASGSSATQRLAEAKGALEQLLAQCYIRRDEVAMLSMRGSKAELILPPTRSLARAKRNLATLPGGGGTPLATGFRAANEMAVVLRRKGLTPVIVILSDGKANVNLKGVGGRDDAHRDALMAAKELRAKSHRVLFVDTSPQPELLAQELSQMMAAHYLALPYRSSGNTISQAAMQLADI